MIASLCGACSIFSVPAAAAGPPVGSGVVSARWDSPHLSVYSVMHRMRGQTGMLKCTLTFSLQQGNRSRGNTLSYQYEVPLFVRFSRSLIGGSDQVLVASATPEPRTRTGQILVKDKGYHVCPQTGPITKFCGYGKYTVGEATSWGYPDGILYIYVTKGTNLEIIAAGKPMRHKQHKSYSTRCISLSAHCCQLPTNTPSRNR